jgi:tRNA-N(6)-(isopentenyl)adenosine-37 thiotransferase enzyme MiaB
MENKINLTQSAFTPLAFIHTFGCQGNLADSDRIRGTLTMLGYNFCDMPELADLVVFNTCAVRENAHNKVYGHIGNLRALKEANRKLKIIVCGCMTAQENVREHIRKHYPYVDIVCGTGIAHKLPSLLEASSKSDMDSEYDIIEDTPIKRDSKVRAWIPIMYGCNNFCTYCIVPYVRGRERSRKFADIYAEVENAVNEGYKDITLLGQNVNSFHDGELNFPELLEKLDKIDGKYILRFMTSHPKDASAALFQVIATSKHIAHHIHLPVQSGSDTILKAMNRGYTSAEYLSLIKTAKKIIPDITLTSDIIVGFPGETEEDFAETLALVKQVEYQNLFTFVYSPRDGTTAANLPDPTTKKEKQQRMARLLEAQEKIAAKLLSEYIGKTVTVISDDEGILRSEGNINVITNDTPPPCFMGKAKITGHTNLKLKGELIQ